MAARLSFDECARIEAFHTAGVDAQQIARQLSRVVSTMCPDLKRNHCDNGGYDASVAHIPPQTIPTTWSRCDNGGYDASVAHHLTDQWARRPKTAKLAADLELAAKVRERQMMRWSPHAISADLRAEGYRVCAETIYVSCYDQTDHGDYPRVGGLHWWLRMIGRDDRSHHKQPADEGSCYGGEAEL